MAVFRVEKTKDYTVMSNHHLRDKDLSLKAKGMLSLMLSLPDDWDYTLAGLEYICKDGITSIRNTVMELEELGYLVRRRLRNEKGQLGDTEYTIHEKPQACGKPVDNPVENPQPVSEKPILEKPILDNPTVGKPILEKHTQSNTNIQNTDLSSTKGSNTHQSITGAGESFPQANGNPGDGIDWIDEFARCRETVKRNIGYDILCENHRNSRQMIDGIVEVMVDCLCVSRRTVKIGGAEYPIEVIREKLLSLDSSHIEYVIECMRENTTKIHQLDHYLLKSLYNAPATIDTHYQNRVNHDMANGFGIKN